MHTCTRTHTHTNTHTHTHTHIHTYAHTHTQVGAELLGLWKEYEDGSTPEACLVKDLDKFDMIFQAYEYEKGDNAALSHTHMLVHARTSIHTTYIYSAPTSDLLHTSKVHSCVCVCVRVRVRVRVCVCVYRVYKDCLPPM